MTEREQFEAWMRECEGYPYAGHYANLMWKSWQASRRAALEQAIKIIEAHKVSVGNSAAGEMACEMTMNALVDVRSAIRALSKE